MSLVTVETDVLAAAETDLAGIGSTISAANAAASAPTAQLQAAAADEVSVAISALFTQHARQYQVVSALATAFHDQFVQALSSAGSSYASTEAASASLLQSVEQDLLNAVNAPVQALLGSPLIGGGLFGNAGQLLSNGGVGVGPVISGTVLNVTASTTSTVRAVLAPLATNVALFMGGTGVPYLPESDVTALFNKYLVPLGYGSYTPTLLYTPEQGYPLTGVKSMTFDPSVQQGVTLLNNAITSQLAAGNNVVVEGWSQSAAIASLEMRAIADGTAGITPSPSQLSFVLFGDPMNPNGGFFSRFTGLNLPSLGFIAYGATPPGTPYPTNIYTGEYDGFADYPRYPLDVLSDLNALIGAGTVHPTYPLVDPSTAILLPGSANLTGQGATNYWMIPTQTLPILSPLQSLPVIGQPLYDLLEPDTRILVNLGYGSISNGWDPGPANVNTEFGLFPPLSVLHQVPQALVAGAQQGVHAFVGDLSHLNVPSAGSSLAALTKTITSTATHPLSLPTPQNIAVALSGALADGYGVVQPSLDIANALFIALPGYDATIFFNALQSGNLIDAVGLPIAADLGVGTFVGGFELFVLGDAIESIIGDLTGLV